MEDGAIHSQAPFSLSGALTMTQQHRPQNRYLNLLKNLFALIGLTCCLVVMLATAAEAYMRFNRPSLAQLYDTAMHNFMYSAHPWSAHRSMPGFTYRTIWINRFGWRGHEWKVTKPQGVKRAVLLGGDLVFGQIQMKESLTISSYLQRILQRKTNQKWQVFNMSVPSAFARMSLAALAHDGLRFAPDAVFVLDGINDLEVLAEPHKQEPFGIRWHPIHRKMQRLYDPRIGRPVHLWANFHVWINKLLIFQRWYSARYSHWLHQRPHPVWQRKSTLHLKDYLRTQVDMFHLSRGMGARFLHFVQPLIPARFKTDQHAQST